MEPQSIEHRGLISCYTAYIYIERERGDGPPVQSSTEALYIPTLHIYTERENGRWTPQSMEHRGIACCYTAFYIYVTGIEKGLEER